jgi:hypothetical protein
LPLFNQTPPVAQVAPNLLIFSRFPQYGSLEAFFSWFHVELPKNPFFFSGSNI